MADMLRVSKDEEQRKREEAQLYSMQQQIDEVRRSLKENIARQQWFEELYRQGEGKVSQVIASQDRLQQDVAQHLSAREIAEGRMRTQLTDLTQRVDAPDKQIRELRAQISDLNNAIKAGKEVNTGEQKQIEEVQRQLREVNSAVSLMSDSQRQLRDLIHDLDSAIGEVRQEALHVAEMQRMEEQRLRRQGVELQGMFEALRQQFTEVSAKSQRVDDVRRQLIERIEAVEELVSTLRQDDETVQKEVERVEKNESDHYAVQHERIEAIRNQIEEQLSEMRQMNDQRMDRYTNRFLVTDERIRSLEQTVSEIPSRFEALERRDETIGAEADSIEEWLVMRQLQAMETLLDEVRQRRVQRAPNFNPKGSAEAKPVPGSVFNPGGLLKNVKDARPPLRKDGAGDPES